MKKCEMIQNVCTLIDSKGSYIKAADVKQKVFDIYKKSVSKNHCESVLFKLSDQGILKCASQANMNGEKLYELKERVK